jgi:serine/threonine protein kinase
MTNGSKVSSKQGTLLGREISNHEIIRLLGAGGMGEVYLARHKVLGVERAIKVIRDSYQDDTATERFRLEAQALGRLQHHNVVQIIDFGHLDNGWPFLCMEYIDGPNLEQAVETRPMKLADAMCVLEQLASALDYSHKLNIVHRDLKPANAILRHSDPRQVKVIDFGLVRLLSKELMTRLTADQQMVGSPIFMAPEQADGSTDITGAADVYALAGIAYVLLTGKPVFLESSLLAFIYAHSQEEPVPLSSRCPPGTIPPLLDGLLLASLAKKPADRPTADELRAHFENLHRQARSDPRDSNLMPVATPAPATVPSQEPPRPYLGELVAASRGGEDPSGVRDAVINQIMQVADELASELGQRDPGIERLRVTSDELQEQITDAEMEAALLDSQVTDVSPAARAEMTAKRNAIAMSVAKLARQLDESRKELLTHIDLQRQQGALSPLYEELDQLVSRLRELTGARGMA